MAVGSSLDIYNRFIQNLPSGWFGEDHPNLDSLLLAFITTYYYQYNNQYLYSILQQRIQTATGYNLDLISMDYEGDNLPRLPNENDDTYRQRILATVVQIKATRQAMYNALLTLTGYPPLIFEGWNVLNCMALGDGSSDPLTSNPICIGGLGYIDNLGVQHTYGNESLGSMSSDYFPYRFSIVVFLPANQGLAQFPGLNNSPTIAGLGYNWYLGSESLVTQIITRNMILHTIELTKTLGTSLAKNVITGLPDLTIVYINS
jgi:hypothetical protein